MIKQIKVEVQKEQGNLELKLLAPQKEKEQQLKAKMPPRPGSAWISQIVQQPRKQKRQRRKRN